MSPLVEMTLSEVHNVSVDGAYIRPSSAGSLPFTSPSIFCRSGGTSVMLKRTALRSNILNNHEYSDQRLITMI